MAATPAVMLENNTIDKAALAILRLIIAFLQLNYEPAFQSKHQRYALITIVEGGDFCWSAATGEPQNRGAAILTATLPAPAGVSRVNGSANPVTGTIHLVKQQTEKHGGQIEFKQVVRSVQSPTWGLPYPRQTLKFPSSTWMKPWPGYTPTPPPSRYRASRRR